MVEIYWGLTSDMIPFEKPLNEKELVVSCWQSYIKIMKFNVGYKICKFYDSSKQSLVVKSLYARGDEASRDIEFNLFLISFDWCFVSELNLATNWSYTGFWYLWIREQSINLDLYFIGYNGTTYQIWGFSDIIWFGFQFWCLKLSNGLDLCQVIKTCLLLFVSTYSVYFYYIWVI